jgi:hypothetical protein
MATAAAGALRAAALQRFTLFRLVLHVRQQRRPWPHGNTAALPSHDVGARARHHCVPEYHVAGAHVAWGAALP